MTLQGTMDDWTVLAKAMSDISEAAFCASWMDELEYRLWEAVLGGSRQYGQITLTTEQLERLRRMSEGLGGWVRFSDETGAEEFTPHEQWRAMYGRWLSERGERADTSGA